MANASAPAAKSSLLLQRRTLTYLEGKYKQQVKLDTGRAVYTVSDANRVFRTDVDWVIGSGKMGQAFLYRDPQGAWHETEVTYYSARGGLGRMLGGRTPGDFHSAAGEKLSESLVRSCFRCHATGLDPEKPLNPSKMQAGIQCGRCHIEALAHIDASRKGQFVEPRKQMAYRSSDDVSEFCGGCHRTWSNVILSGIRGPDNVRFQPYRLANSKCFNSGDLRISCLGCHDPHRPLETSSSFYDGKCLSCHSAVARPAGKVQPRVCKTSTHDCTSCHMPKYTLPNTQETFTDHWIRLVKVGEGYPG